MEVDREDIKSKHKSILLQAKLVSAFFIVMLLPTALNRFFDFEGKLGLGEWGRIWMLLAGSIVYSIYFGFFYKCPQCRRFPGAGWNRYHCKSCGVELRDPSE